MSLRLIIILPKYPKGKQKLTKPANLQVKVENSTELLVSVENTRGTLFRKTKQFRIPYANRGYDDALNVLKLRFFTIPYSKSKQFSFLSDWTISKSIALCGTRRCSSHSEALTLDCLVALLLLPHGLMNIAILLCKMALLCI